MGLSFKTVRPINTGPKQNKYYGKSRCIIIDILKRHHIKERITYFILFSIFVVIEVLIALFVHDKLIRPYIGDVIVVWVMYCFVHIFIPNRIKLLPLYLFLFSAAVEIAQYFNYVSLLGLENNKFFRILLGTSFSFADLLCYAVGSAVCFIAEYFLHHCKHTKNMQPLK